MTISELSDTNCKKLPLAKLKHNFFHRKKINETPIRCFYKDVLDKFSRLKLLSEHSQGLL